MSNIQNTDLVLVSRSGTHYDCPASDLSARLADGDFLLVSRSGTLYKVSGANVDNIADTDTLLISRGTTPYKVTGADFKTLLGPDYPTKAQAFGSVQYFGNGVINGNTQSVISGAGPVSKHTVFIHPSQDNNVWAVGGNKNSGIDQYIVTPSTSAGFELVYDDVFKPTWSSNSFGVKYTNTNGVLYNKLVNASGFAYVGHHFNHAEGFHDSVVYDGNGGTQRINHGLKELPGAVMIFEIFSGSILNDRRSAVTLWHNMSSNVVHVVTPNISNPDPTATGSLIYTSSRPISAVTSEYIDVLNTNDFTNRSGGTYVALFFGGYSGTGDTSLIKCGQYTGNGGSSQTLTMGFAPSFYWQWRADSYPTVSNDLASGRMAAQKNASARPNLGIEWDRIDGDDGVADIDMISSWNVNGLTLDSSISSLGWNTNGVKFNYIAI